MSDFKPPNERHKQILALLGRQGSLSVTQIVEQFAVSEATARRDLELLASQAKVQRVYGGATAIQQAPPELPVLERQTEQSDEKLRIGQAAAALVPNGASLFLGSGTTVLQVARCLREHSELTIFTNSLPVINALADLPGLNLIGLGGIFRHSELSFIGHITEHILAEIHVDMVIIGTRAINLQQGLTNDYLPETMTDRAILEVGRRVVLVTDHTKFGRISMASLAPLESVDTVVTDIGTPEEYLRELESRSVGVIRA
jgi:DeoR family transcriptional regulator of aga operon